MLIGSLPHIVQLRSGFLRISVPEGATEVVVTFEGADQTIPRKDFLRTGFGEKFLLAKGYAVVSVLTNSANWFRPTDMQDALSNRDLCDFLQRFDRRHSYGSSMGGFGALVFADVLAIDNVIAMQPISSLRADLVPWETRFRPGASLDWTGAFADAAEGISRPQTIWAFFDPADQDAPHAARLGAVTGARFRPVPVKGAAHAVPLTLQRAGILGAAVEGCLKGDAHQNIAELVAKSRSLGARLTRLAAGSP